MGLGRSIRLEAENNLGTVRFLSSLRVDPQGDSPTSWVTLTRTGKFSDPRYGEFEISREMLLAMVENFNKRTYGQDIFIDVAHRPSDGAAAKVVRLAVEGDRLRALVEWTQFGLDAVRNKGYRYLSAEYHENWRDNEQGLEHGPLLMGAGLTIRPVIKRLEPVQLSEDSVGAVPTLVHPTLAKELSDEVTNTMNKFKKKLLEKLATMSLSQATVDGIAAAFDEGAKALTEDAQFEALVGQFEALGKQLAEQIGDKPTTIQLSMPSGGLTAEDVSREVARVLAAQEAGKKLAEDKLAANRKLLADTIDAAPGLADELKRELAEGVADLVTGDMTEGQIKSLAGNQIKHGNELVAARSLAAMGYQFPSGSLITVDFSNEVKALQEIADTRLGLKKLSDARRYSTTLGQLQDVNKELAEAVLKQFDAVNGHRLHAEHKMLAGGDGLVSDVAVPATFERTVIREALYRLNSTQFMDVGTAPFSASNLIPYSYRDTTAAGRDSTRKYEGQAIARAGVKQAMETAYPIPQKLAFEVSDEMRYLTANGQLVNWDLLAENAANAFRIIGEDLERLNFNEQVDAADQYAVTAVTNEATATANGTNKIFVLDNFPVVRPKKVYDLQGAQVGSTLYPIDVKVNAVSLVEYDFTNTQSAGTYYWMDYNLGEVHIVNQAGVPVAPTNGQAVVCSYSYTTNVFKFDTDLGSLTVKEKWDDFIYRFGLRKSVIEDQRSYACNFGLMSGTVMNMVEQAGSFTNLTARKGTDLAANGNLGMIKDVAQYKSFAPGLLMGDQRVVIGERGQSRLRIAKPWSLGQLQDQKDANGRFTGKKEAYGDQFIFLHTPTQLKAALTTIVLYGATARVDRAS